MSHVFGRRSPQQLPVATRGEGIYLFDADGKRYLDACGGAAVSCLGHSNAAVIDAARSQLSQLAWAHSGFFTTGPAEELAGYLAGQAPGALNHVYFVSGGSEAVEAALKLARQYWIESGHPERNQFISRRQSYHGNTLGALGAGGNQWRRAPFEALLGGNVHLVDPCYHYRGALPGESEHDYGQRMANQLEATINAVGPERVAAFIAEPVVGATLGAVPAVAGYFRRIREICDQYGVLLILDEVMCGMGRTGSRFAFEQEDVVPDIVCFAKALGAGIQPIGAMMCTTDLYNAIAAGTGFFQHGHTYMGHPVACAAALAVQQEIDRNNLLANVCRQGNALREQLTQALGDHPNVGDIRGRGLFVGVELVADRNTRAPLDPARKTHAAVKAAAFANGLMVYPMGGTLDGKSGDHVLLAPPYTCTDADTTTIVALLRQTLEQVLPIT